MGWGGKGQLTPGNTVCNHTLAIRSSQNLLHVICNARV